MRWNSTRRSAFLKQRSFFGTIRHADNSCNYLVLLRVFSMVFQFAVTEYSAQRLSVAKRTHHEMYHELTVVRAVGSHAFEKATKVSDSFF
jgi:hypothetical protein